MFIKKLPYICQQMKKKECTIPLNEKVTNETFLNVKPRNPAVYVLRIAQEDFTLISKHKFQKNQYILHHTCTTTTCTTKKSCDQLYSGVEISEIPQSQLSSFIKFSKNPNCFLVKNFVNKELNLGVYALRDISEGEELSICKNVDNLLEISNEFGLLFPKELNLKFLRSIYLEKLIEKLNNSDLDTFELNSLEISLEERNYLNNLPNLVSITQSLENSILSHFTSSNNTPSTFLSSLKNISYSNKVTLISLTKITLKLFNLDGNYYNQIYLTLSLENSTITLTQKLSMLLNTYRLFLLWINRANTFTYVSRLEQFIICYVISFNCLMESWISINDWAKLLLSIGVLTVEKDVGDVVCEDIVERFKWLQLRCLECVEYKCMITLCSYYKFLNKVCDKFEINKLI